MKEVKENFEKLFNLKPYEPKPHPMQHRIDEFRKVPSLVTGGKHD